MTDNVVQLPKMDRHDEPVRIWACACGCRSMILKVDGNAECAACEHRLEADNGGWYTNDVRETAKYAGEEPFELISFGAGEDAADLAKRRVLNRAQGEAVAAVVVVQNDGTISTWTHVETGEHYAWLKRRLKAALELMDPRKSGYDKDS